MSFKILVTIFFEFYNLHLIFPPYLIFGKISKNVYDCWRIFMMADLKSLSHNCSIWFLMVFVDFYSHECFNFPLILVSVQSLSHVWLFVTVWTAARQASLSITYSWSWLKLMSVELVMPSNHLILCHILLLLPAIFPSIRVFSNESVLRIGDQSIGASASASVLSTNIQDWFPLGWIGWLSLLSKGLSRVFSNTTVQKHQSSVLSFLYSPNFFLLTSIHDYWKNHSLD